MFLTSAPVLISLLNLNPFLMTHPSVHALIENNYSLKTEYLFNVVKQNNILRIFLTAKFPDVFQEYILSGNRAMVGGLYVQ